MTIAMAIATTNYKACSSFVLSSIYHPIINKSAVATNKGILIHQKSRSFLTNYNTSTRLFSSTNPSSPEGAAALSKEQKYQELIGASTLQLAPMMEYTDRHFRHVIRLISGKTLLYTEMVAANALARERNASMDEYSSSISPPPSEKEIRENYSDQYLQRYLGQGQVQPLEGPSVLQLGGSEPNQLYQAAQTVMDMVS
ncbi:MAG: hypothetical protein ACI8RD_001642 [Bacillariaceae sp.]|jgi:hypothetical protein